MSQMLDEAKEAPFRVQEALNLDEKLYFDLGERLRKLQPAMVATVARGSSDHAAAYASYLLPQCTGKIVASVAPSLVTVLGSPLNLNGQFVLSLSQSGSSPDIVRTVEILRASGALTAALVNNDSSPLAKTAEILLRQHAGVETCVAATKTVVCTLVAIARIAAQWSRDEKLNRALASLPVVLERAFASGMTFDDQLLRGVSRAYVLSRGLGLSSALEVALKLKETCGLHAEAFSTAEVRHGPREIVDESFLVIGIGIPGSGIEDVKSICEELRAQGARSVLISPEAGYGSLELPTANDFRLMPLVALQALYPWLARSSKALGRDPDRPKILTSKVVNTF